MDIVNNVMMNIAKVDLDKAKTKEHTLQGLIIALKDIDTAIALIKESLNKEEARNKLIKHFNITEIQANAILDMKLSKLTKLDKDDLLNEIEELRLAIQDYENILNNEVYRSNKLIEKIIAMRDKYGDERRTELVDLEIPKEEKEKVYVEPEKCVVMITESGLIKRIPTASFKVQKRAGKGIKTQDDITKAVIRTNTVDSLMVFTNQGKMYRLSVNDVPVGTNSSKGTSIKSLIELKI